ncbi:hypothetical protein GmHk_01G000966 [Glycine max]|nr:hypothetical protein GmHk_01G000966 [Glycine max]
MVFFPRGHPRISQILQWLVLIGSSNEAPRPGRGQWAYNGFMDTAMVNSKIFPVSLAEGLHLEGSTSTALIP